jgi:hypothetical protein
MYGIKLSMLTEDMLEQILLIYEKIIGGDVRLYAFSAGSRSMSVRLNKLKKKLHKYSREEWVYGSKLGNGMDINAKLIIKVEKSVFTKGHIVDHLIVFYFDPNIYEDLEEAKLLCGEFRNAIDDYLIGIGLAVKISE